MSLETVLEQMGVALLSLAAGALMFEIMSGVLEYVSEIL